MVNHSHNVIFWEIRPVLCLCLELHGVDVSRVLMFVLACTLGVLGRTMQQVTIAGLVVYFIRDPYWTEEEHMVQGDYNSLPSQLRDLDNSVDKVQLAHSRPQKYMMWKTNPQALFPRAIVEQQNCHATNIQIPLFNCIGTSYNARDKKDFEQGCELQVIECTSFFAHPSKPFSSDKHTALHIRERFYCFRSLATM